MDVGSAIVALSGTVIGAGLTLAMELVRARIGDRASRRNALLASCSSFTAAVARMDVRRDTGSRAPEAVFAELED
ncbi:hypothetical protein [Dactylosporangium sp. NPDC049140]|uniref:hypothetical protein n=1 Tax=Dactylosporangium sp. NPDC049140 TaxID=3155647 RepID=UPI0033DE46B5